MEQEPTGTAAARGRDDTAPEPAWLRELREKAAARHAALPAPARNDEAWRFTDLKKLGAEPGAPAPAVSPAEAAALAERSSARPPAAGRMVFANDRLALKQDLPRELAEQGVIWLPLDVAAREHPDLVRRHFMVHDAILGGAKYQALHASRTRAGTFLYVPKNVVIDQPLEVDHWASGDGAAVYPHTLLIAGENSRVTLVDRFRSARPGEAAFACGVNDLHLEPGSRLTHVGIQDWSRSSRSFQFNATTVGRDASAKGLIVNLGSAYARSENVSRLSGAGGRSDMLSVSVADGDQEFDQRTFQIHQVPNTQSDLLYKNALDGRARTTFSGLIRVEPGAHKTDAYQKVRNLMLSDEAEANSAPGLEIEADDVRCTHGATTGEIEGEELFYLLARGIAKKDAQRLIVFGFLEEVFERLDQPALAADLSDLIHARFDGR
jgi:Fe-S cluster assembly protein SufD